MKRTVLSSIIVLLLVFGICGQLAAFQTGHASWYGGKFQGRPTANGEIFDTNKLTAAHRTFPFNTILRVTNLKNGRSVVVRVNDRGPFVQGRIIDLSRAAAQSIDMIEDGTVPVRIEVVNDHTATTGDTEKGSDIESRSPEKTGTTDGVAAVAAVRTTQPPPPKAADKPETEETVDASPTPSRTSAFPGNSQIGDDLPLPVVHDVSDDDGNSISHTDDRGAGLSDASDEETSADTTSGRTTTANTETGSASHPSTTEPASKTNAREEKLPTTFTIQVGSFSVLENAINLKRKLEASGLSVGYEPAGDGIMRVILPKIPHSKLSGTQEELSAAGVHDILIRREN